MFNLKKVSLVALLAIAATPAFAVVDTTAVQAELDAMVGYMTLVGGALIVAAATAVGYKWIKGALFS